MDLQAKANAFFEKGQQLRNSGNYEEAYSYFKSSYSLKLDPNTLKYMKICERKIKNRQQQQQQRSSSSHQQQQDEEKEEEEKEEQKDNGQQRNGNSRTQQTQAQKDEECQRILNKKDFYDILGVNKNANKNQIKKAYRKSALKFHPDKNDSQHAEEAFKYISKAYDCLNNDEKRAFYDRYGEEEPQQRQQRYSQQYQEDIDPNDIFRMFFGPGFVFQGGRGGMRGGLFGRRRNNVFFNQGYQQNNNQPRRQPTRLQKWLSALPFILIIGSSLLTQINFEYPTYSLQRTYQFQLKRTTSTLNVIYYTDKENSQKMLDDEQFKDNLEEKVDIDYINHLSERCYFQQRKKRDYQASARWSSAYNKLANDVDLTTCEQLREIQIDFPMYNRY